jgi:hypothetical protein
MAETDEPEKSPLLELPAELRTYIWELVIEAEPGSGTPTSRGSDRNHIIAGIEIYKGPP